jgi:group II intron reverse transcriptase/maturase
MKYENVIEKVYSTERLHAAWQQVKKNAGAGGIDRMTVAEFERREAELLALIQRRLQEGRYRFRPARRVLIPKEGTGKMRKLGIPTVMDRVTSQSMNLALAEIFDPEFTESNFGFRRGQSQHKAIEHVRRYVKERYDWCASIDLHSFFDEIPHDLIIRLIRRKVADEQLITLVARALKAGVMVDGQFEKTTKGCPQGSPLSPLISNIVLNELDQELERRGLRYARWADDFVVLLKSQRSAQRVGEGITGYLENTLGLQVNQEKSLVAPVKEVVFLGFQILRNKIRVSGKARQKFKEKIRRMTKRNNPLSMQDIIIELNLYLRGWCGYFRIQEFRILFRDLDAWIRSRLRSIQLKKWKNPRKFQRMMCQAGWPPEQSQRTWIRMNKWQSVERRPVRFVLNLEWFRQQGLYFLNDFTAPTLRG